MFLGDLVKQLSADLFNTYSFPWDVNIIEMGEGDINIEAVPKHNQNECVLGVQLFLNYTRFSIELSIKNAPPVVSRVFKSIESVIKLNLNQVIAISDILSEKGLLQFYINGHKYTCTELKTISPWLSLSIRFDSNYTDVYDNLDFHYQNFKSQVIAFAGLILVSSKTMDDVEKSLPKEGKEILVTESRYERNPINRSICLESKGYRCSVCGINMEEMYGEIGKGFIEVHHIIPVSEYGEERLIDPLKELVPVCPNCHAMLHKRKPPFSIEELKLFIKNASRGEK